MSQHLTDMQLTRVSLVDKGANQRRFAILKRDPDGDELGLIERIAKRVADLVRLPVEKAATKTVNGQEFGAKDFAYVPDASQPSTWKLRIAASPGGGPDAGMVGRAIAAIGPKGYRGQKADIPSGDLAGVKSKLRSAWRKANPDKESSAMPDVIRKAQTFDEIRAGDELREELPDAFYTLQDALWSAMWATDDAGQTLPIDQRIELVSTDLEQFRTYLVGVLQQAVGKRDPGASLVDQTITAVVAKVGSRSSAALQARLEKAASALTEVLAEARAESTAIEKQEDEMTPEELTAAIQKANEPLIERIDALEKRSAAEKPAEPEPVKKDDQGAGEGDGDPVTLEGVAKAVVSIADRLERVEKAPGERTSAAGQEGGEVKKSRWAGLF